jgi:hypothetical protein
MALILIAPLVGYFVTRSLGAAWIAFIVPLAFTILTRIDELAEFSLGPLKARMRETIAEAAATVEQLRAVGAAIARVVLTDMMAGSFLGGINNARRFDLHDEIMAQIDAIGVTKHQREQMESEWKKGVHWIYSRAVGKHAGGANAEKWNAMGDFDSWRAPTPNQMEKFFADVGISPIPEAAVNWIADYRHFLQTNEIRNRALFMSQ